MKTIKSILLAGIFVSLFACSTNVEDIMTADDVAALQAMATAYTNAAEYNDSLASYINNTGITNDETNFYYDDMYHQYDSMFATNHAMYSHNNNGDDHDGSSWMMGSGWMSGNGNMGNSGMMGNGGMMNSEFNASFCVSNNLDLMDSLMNAHEDYHPGN
jgi:hypothetical protein